MSNSLNISNAVGGKEFLPGGGEMSRRISVFDWSQTPLGPISQWPQSLKAALGICIGSRFPIAIYWGRELVLLYNDAWSPIPGKKHPWALGRPAAEVWPEIWDVIGPLFEQVQTTGEATYLKDGLLLMHRHDYTEECYFDYTFTPVRGETGETQGVFNAVIETTYRVIGERRTRTLRDLAARTAEAQTVEEACTISADVLSKSVDVPFAGIYLLDADGVSLRLAAAAGIEPSAPVVPREMDSQTARDWPVLQTICSRNAQVVNDVISKFGPIAGGPWGHPVNSAVLLPLARPGRPAPYGVLVAAATPQRALDEDFLSFFDMVAGQVATAIGNARALEEERARAEALAEIDRAKTAFFSNVSHEFRTPLTLMLGPLEELLARSYTELPPAAKGQLEVTHRNSLRLLRLVNTLLDFSRI